MGDKEDMADGVADMCNSVLALAVVMTRDDDGDGSGDSSNAMDSFWNHVETTNAKVTKRR